MSCFVWQDNYQRIQLFIQFLKNLILQLYKDATSRRRSKTLVTVHVEQHLVDITLCNVLHLRCESRLLMAFSCPCKLLTQRWVTLNTISSGGGFQGGDHFCGLWCCLVRSCCCWRCKRESLFGSFIGICIETAFYTNRRGVLNGWNCVLLGRRMKIIVKWTSICLAVNLTHITSRSNEEVPCLACLFGGVQRRSGNVLIETHSNCTFGTCCGWGSFLVEWVSEGTPLMTISPDGQNDIPEFRSNPVRNSKWIVTVL